MTRVEFYVLPDAEPASRLRAACQLAAKGWQHGMRVFVRCENDAQRDALDDLLWHFRAERFIPHDRFIDDPQSPVVLGGDEVPAQPQGLLVNLAPTLSTHLDQFSRVIEIVNQEPERLALSRDNFRQYRRHGYDPKRVEL
ncbi:MULTISPECIES: DNA polymerase III subunit chi [Stutzerimonas]|jgi:DNA polymerase-3 subunit chi|uniref:DNA polymerase III subunit chi n=1 Tax=Stutzerimonas balearica TaxID=74829 RepID=A0A9X7YTZ0_9GAMM|nr:DNA polymerase III subunit chi [Stutzerimonas balearica]KIL04615.1 DNA polymerase III subunit chi [Stutzerimonas stutzeri]MBB61386.1 DNA polymerase III subunit chi [Pseudomonas sp.]MBZ5755498.1 DNA polymerase III subunit chi [Pseudomonas sp. S5(2021)]MBC7200834.1 DNA polymerase III subunit chi [Stutzerimonas balearica]MBD3737481.1 DNA polymerase III subunit chi [Stutzerimonas balearica]